MEGVLRNRMWERRDPVADHLTNSIQVNPAVADLFEMMSRGSDAERAHSRGGRRYATVTLVVDWYVCRVTNQQIVASAGQRCPAL